MSSSNFSKQKQTAGKFIASGAYGCTFYPHLKCKDVPNKKNTIGKVFPDANDADEENKIMIAVKSKLDPNNEFTVPFHGTCKVHYLRQTDDATACPLINKDNVKSVDQLLYAYGGQALSKRLRTKGSIPGLLKLLPGFLPILAGLAKMNILQWVHFDVKPDNMLVLHDKLFLIDFGIVSFESDVYSNANAVRLISDYAWYPPEFKVFFFKKHNEFDRLYKRVMDNFQGSNAEVATAMVTVLKTNPIKDLESFFKDKVPKKEYTHLASKVDIYSLGIVLLKLYLWSGFHQKVYKRKTTNYVLRERLLALLSKMVQFDPRKRINANDAYSEFKALIG